MRWIIVLSMTGTRLVLVAGAVAATLALIVPAAGQGKSESASLGWSQLGGGPTITSYGYGAVDGGLQLTGGPSQVVRGFRLGSVGPAESGKLTIDLTGSSRFSIASDRCTGKSIRRKLSCRVRVAYAPRTAETSDRATLTATGEAGVVARLRLSGRCSAGEPGHVYWVNTPEGTVNAGPRGGGCPAVATTLASGQGCPLAVAVHDAHAYWVGCDGTVKKVSLGGGSVTTLASGQHYPDSVAVDGTDVYWTNQEEGSNTGTVNEVPLGGGSVTTIASGQDYPNSLAVDGTNVYWLSGGAVNEAPLGGGSVTTLASGLTAVSFAWDGTHVYWISPGHDFTDGTVKEVPLGGGAVTTLASGQYDPLALAVDGTHVYWVDCGTCDSARNGTVNEVPLGGGPVTVLARGQSRPGSVAVDGTRVYWTNSLDGSVSEVPLGGGTVTNLAILQNGPASVAVGP
jgi:hypothetical protein